MPRGFRAEVDAAKTAVRGAGATVYATALGPIEALIFGDGSPVLCVHGVIGGADQAPLIAPAFVGDGFRIIAISRFGYLGSPLPSDASAQAQADRCAALLDRLGIEQVALVGSSAGTASSIYFALRHPDRCAALVIWSQAVPPYSVPPPFAQAIMRTVVFSDFAFWFLMAYLPARMLKIMGVPLAVQKRLSPTDKELVTSLMHGLMPVSLRRAGIMNDVTSANPALNTIVLDQLAVPTLSIHAADDPWGSHAGAQKMWAGVPNACFVGLDDGGHLLSGHVDEARGLIREFITTHHSHAG